MLLFRGLYAPQEDGEEEEEGESIERIEKTVRVS